MRRQLVETASSALTKSGGRWRVVVAKPGQGTSGYYSESVLRDYGPAALPAGSKSYINHDPKRDPRDLLGFFPDGAVYEEGTGLVAELEVLPHYRELVEAVAPHTGMSLYMMGEADEDDNIVSLLPNRINSCDLVGYPGLEGSGVVEKLYEAARMAAPNEPAVIVAEEKETSMDEKDIKAVAAATAAAVAESIKPLVAFISETATKQTQEVQAQADADAVASAVESALAGYQEKVDAIDAAELLETQAARIKAEALKGADVTSLIESAKADKEAARVAFAESGNGGGYVAADDTAKYEFPKGW